MPLGPSGLPTHAYDPRDFAAEVAAAGLRVRALYGCQGLGAHLQEEHLLDLMADAARWPAWERALLDTCDHPNIIGVSSHLLAVANRAGVGDDAPPQ